MRNRIFFILIILIYNFCYSQKSLNEQFKKIIVETKNKHDVKVITYGIDNKLWTDYIEPFKENDTISFYTTSNLPFCKSKIFIFYPRNYLTINFGDECNEPPSISVAEIKYNYKIKKDLLKIFYQGKIYCLLKIINIENYQQEKFGKESYKLTFLVIK